MVVNDFKRIGQKVAEQLACSNNRLLPTGSEESEVLKVGTIPVAILPCCQDMKTIAL